MRSLCLGCIFGLVISFGTVEKSLAGAVIERRDKTLIPLKRHFNSEVHGYTSTLVPEPEFTGSIGSHTTIAGRDAVLKCVIENLGDYKVAWMNVEQKDLLSIGVHVISKKEGILVTTPDYVSWYLHIKNVTEKDIGYYMCQINTQPMKSQVGYLDVVVPPEFVFNMNNRNLTIMENSNVTMSCKATGIPTPIIKWKREDGQPFVINGVPVREYENEELALTDITRLHMAAYLCLASNKVPPPISRRMYLNVMFPPLIWILNQLVGAPEGMNVSLECHTEAHPTSQNFWLKETDVINPSGDDRYRVHLERNTYKAAMKLTIHDLRFEDYGHYKCVAQNYIGATVGAITLYRLKIPSPPPKPITQEMTTLPTRDITVAAQTENNYLQAEVERREYTIPPRKQEKYGTVVVYNNSKKKNEGNAIRATTMMQITVPIAMLLWCTFSWR